MQPFIHIPEQEINFTTARSGGKGGQHVNKVETAVTGHWYPAQANWLSAAQKELVLQKLGHRLTSAGALVVKSQVHKSQLSNKAAVVKKISQLVHGALTPKKARIATRPGKAAKEKRLANKKHHSLIKQERKRFLPSA